MTNMQKAKAILGSLVDNIEFEVEECYLDYGARLMHTTLIAYRNDGASYQWLSPRETEEINKAKNGMEICALCMDYAREREVRKW